MPIMATAIDQQAFEVVTQVNIPGVGLQIFTRMFSAHSLTDAVEQAEQRVVVTPRKIVKTGNKMWSADASVTIPGLPPVNVHQSMVNLDTIDDALASLIAGITVEIVEVALIPPAGIP